MISEVMRHIRNYFPTGEYIDGTYTIQDGTIDLPFLLDGQYFLIEGSVLNDGVYQYPPFELDDETFTGTIVPLKPPKAFLNLCEDIREWVEKYGGSNAGPYSSESFGGYTYTRATNQNGSPQTWKDVFARRLNEWRKV